MPEQLRRIRHRQAFRQLQHVIARNRAQHGASLRLARAPAAEGNELVEERQPVAHAAIRGLRDEREARGLELYALLFQDGAQMRGNLRERNPFEVELQTARQHRDRQLLRVGGGEQELHVRRRLLESFEERVEGVCREHVYLVDQVHLVAATGGRVLHVVEELAGVIDLGAGGGVDLDEIEETPGIDLAAAGALT